MPRKISIIYDADLDEAAIPGYSHGITLSAALRIAAYALTDKTDRFTVIDNEHPAIVEALARLREEVPS